ncbi:hypothetical protein ZYGR_0AS02120 [Zygosaccharomyces rouxii]|uniref:Zn(2)-C6 fungal-type domain-containing protein n=1 Tax=Zygosaccharomyces rouxii TaxID=4956 RepID=A0A1Q3AGI7_ZYGRO|nr:hypothetical protein ZYGR_0AS02120 [Zygosaccharomyces rouxii]
MSTSIPVLNRNHSLPPLLLPASRPVTSGVGGSADSRQDPFSAGGNGKRSGSLDGLTQLAVKRARIDESASSNSFNDVSNSVPLPLLFASPIPLVGSSVPKSGSVSSVSSMSSGSSVSDSSTSSQVGFVFRDHGARSEANEDHVTEKKGNKLTPPPSAPSATRERNSPRSSASGPSSNSSSKRQRVGPSCDGCRLKKIKCDAHVEIILQDPRVLSQISNKLHQVISRDQLSEMDWKVDLSMIPMDSVLVKHIDKIVMFKPCTSCNKRRASLDGSQGPLDGKNDNVTGGGCVFSKGFTRADINVFVKICKRVGTKPVQEMTVEDYHEAGF